MNSQKETENDDRNRLDKKLYVRYMVSLRCKLVAKSEIDKLGITHLLSSRGAIEFPEGISNDQKKELNSNLKNKGLVLLDTAESRLIEKIIDIINDFIHDSKTLPKVSFREIIHENLGDSSESILKIFSEVKGVSVTQFIINQKIERAKEFLLYEDISIPEISDKLNYKNKNFFVSQFKKNTGLAPSYFIKIKEKRKKNMKKR